MQGQEQEVWNKHECPMVANECHLGGYQMQLADYFSIDITHDLGNWTLNGILSLSLPSSRVEFCFPFEDPAWLHPKPKEKAMGLKEYQATVYVQCSELPWASHWLYEISHMDMDNQAWGRMCWILCWWVSFFHCQVHSRQLLKDTECGTGAGKPGHGSEAHCRTKESRS
jgi:hypothetical protein